MEENEHLLTSAASKKYAGNPWLSGNTIVLILSSLLFLIICITLKGEEKIIPAAFVTLIIIGIYYMGTALKMNYFIVEKHRFIVKNHYSLSEYTIIPIIEISGFEIIRPYKSSKTLKVYFANGKTHLFTAGSLNKKDWEEFKKDMTAAGFTVKDIGSLF